VIALIDYKAGNLTSVRKALGAVGAEVYTPEAPADLKRAHGIIVPGVGHFGATRALDREWIETILDHIGEGRPLLGICLGMQWLYESSEEAPELAGLGLLSGSCRKLRPSAPLGTGPGDSAREIKVPHVGWNSLNLTRPGSSGSIVEGVDDEAQVYFTHSYVAPVTPETVASTEHGEVFASIVQRGQVAGVQFHPEKSGDVGLRVLRNFLAMAG
jgi:imidazole glycerol-phosphate synthase subunit HisH